MHSPIPAWIDNTLTPVAKLEVHQRGLRHMAVSVFVIAGDNVLIQQRALTKYHTPGLWANTCCTHPHWDEPALTCAHRRLSQELGISGLTLTPAGEVEYRADVGQSLIEHEVVQIFTALAPLTLPITPNPAEVMATKWIPLADLLRATETTPEIFTPWLRIYLHDHPQILARATQTQP